jgi:DNA-binding NarL/FixJ family response regulator
MRIALVDDHALFRDGITSLLSAWGHEVVGGASDGAEAVALVDETSPDVVLMDVRMPNVSGVEAVARIKERHPEVAIVMLTVSEDEADLFRAIKAGAEGYLLKNLEAPQLRSMLEGVARGEPAITPATASRIIDELRTPPGPNPEASQLTKRELGVLNLVTAGQRNREIGTELGISENTVKFHLKNIVEKLHTKSRAELAAVAVRDGLVADPPRDMVSHDPVQRDWPPRHR